MLEERGCRNASIGVVKSAIPRIARERRLESRGGCVDLWHGNVLNQLQAML